MPKNNKEDGKNKKLPPINPVPDKLSRDKNKARKIDENKTRDINDDGTNKPSK